MKLLFFFSIIAAVAIIIVIWSVTAKLLDKLAEGQKTQDDLRETRSKLDGFKKRCDVIQKEHEQALQKMRRKIEKQGDIIHNVKQQLKKNKEAYESTIIKKDHLFEQIKQKNNESVEYISSLFADYLTLQYDISAEYLETKKHPAYKEAQRIRELKNKTKEMHFIEMN